jgi:hypothetical protein
LSSSKVIEGGGTVGGKDMSLAAVVDETIQLWTKMWVADADYDNAVAENVQGMQTKCSGLLRQLIRELQDLRLQPLHQTAGRRKLAAVSKSETAGQK